MTESMLAAVTSLDGAFEVAEVPRPAAGRGEILIKVAAAGVNPADWGSRQMPDDPSSEPGAILGWDVAGTVTDVGMGVTRFRRGDQVFGMPHFPHPAQAYAQYATARSREMARIPDGVSMLQAGAVPLAGLTAWQALVDTANVGAGSRVLIHAASGGVGHLAVQVAKARGAEVWGTASAAKHEQLRELGADHLINYRSEKFEDVATEIDVVLALGGDQDIGDRSAAVMRRGGRYIAVGAGPMDPDMALAAGVEADFMLVEPDYASLESIGALMASGEVRVVIAEQRPLDRVAELHEIGQSGGPLGKLVIDVGAS